MPNSGHDCPEELLQIAETVTSHPGAASKPTRTVRELIGWFGNRGRGRYVKERVHEVLADVGLRTEPDFRAVHLDASVAFHPKEAVARIDLDDPTTRVSRLLTADLRPNDPDGVHGLAQLRPEEPLSKATSLMLLNGFSQIPVLKGRSDIRGVVSWRSIGARIALGHDLPPETPVHRALDPVGAPVRLTDSILRAARRVAEEDFVLVVDSTRSNEVTGIVTASDLTDLFRDLSGAFILLGEIGSSTSARSSTAGSSPQSSRPSDVPRTKRRTTTSESRTCRLATFKPFSRRTNIGSG